MSDRRNEAAPSRPPAVGIRPRSPAEALEPTRAPQRPRGARVRRERPRLSATVRWLSGALTLMLVAMVAGGGSLGVLLHQLDQPGPLDVTRTVAIPRGEGRIDIAARLEREGVISNRWMFVASHIYQSWGNKKSYELKAGEYEVKKQSSLRQVMETLVEGRAVLHRVSIPEGLTSQQIIERLRADPQLTGDIDTVPPEGSLLPETYKFSKGISRVEIVERMQADHQKVVAGLWEKRQRDLPFQTLEQALVLASIIEKETGRADERDRVAAVFVNRLRKGMRLQSDPTIIYGLVGGQGPLGRPITRSDIESRTPYNTYVIDGLPPTPICNPGRSAIEATLNPAKTGDLFFVADGTGGHTFSQTLKDHNAAVANWRRIEKDAKSRQPDTAQPPSAPAVAPGGKSGLRPTLMEQQPAETAAEPQPSPAAAPEPAAPAARKQKTAPAVKK